MTTDTLIRPPGLIKPSRRGLITGAAALAAVAGKASAQFDDGPRGPRAFPRVLPGYIPSMPDLGSFTTFNVASTRFVTGYPGKAFIIGDTNVSGTLQIHGVYKTHNLVPPFRIAMLMGVTGRSVNYLFPTFGWRDSVNAKYVTVNPFSVASSWEYHSWSNPTTRAIAAGVSGGQTPISNTYLFRPTWFAVRDDGAGTVFYEMSTSGQKDDYYVINQVTKSGSYLTNYDQVCFGMFQQSATGGLWETIWYAYDEQGLIRSF